METNLIASRWGLRGTEDIGSGTSAFFSLEAGFDSSDGSAAADPGYGWQRRAILGLKNEEWGEVRFGREVAPIFYAILPVSDRNTAGSSSTNSLGGVQFNSPGSAGRFDGMVTYVSPSMAGVTASVAVANLGKGTERPKSANVIYESKEFSASAGWMKTNAQGTLGAVAAGNALRESWLTGFMYRGVEGWQFYGGFEDARQTTLGGVRTADFSLTWLGVNFDLNPALTLKTAFYRRADRGSSNGANLYSVSGEYAMSKRTTLYTKLDKVSNNGTSNLGVAQNSTIAAGNGSTQLSMGMIHTF